ncbi:MAG TPA: phosphonopyruvate decarboxylase [Burkholderiaceae bacterium]|jgi:phosphonopyruvate decarboxylase|nr:phosphonopyruvate decarboxylase [Burkholderiaceae bacterium]
MIQARDFVEAARERRFEWYAGVPCSYLSPFINYVLQERSLRYLSMANEGDAVALIAGIAVAGAAGLAHGRGVSMMQNSGLGNAVSPLTSLTWAFRLPQLLIVTWRGKPGEPDEPQHQLMGAITPEMLRTMQIAWELFPTEVDAIGPALDRATAHMDGTGLPYALVMQKGSVAPHPIGPQARGIGERSSATPAVRRSRGVSARARPSRRDALREIVAHSPVASSVLVASTGFCGRELYAVEDRPNHLYMVGSMGCVVPFALGLALARPDRQVIALDGDGAALMRMGAFATVGAYGPPNLLHLLLDNGMHESTGGQATVSPLVSFGDVAAACGYAWSIETDDLGEVGAWLAAPALAGARFARVLTKPGVADDLPRPSVAPVEVKARLMRHLGPMVRSR